METTPELPAEVLRAFGLTGSSVRCLPSLINLTFLVERGEQKRIVQRLHPIFAPEVHQDIEAITAHLASRGELTPRLLRTSTGELSLKLDGAVWRALTHIEGVTHDRVPDAGYARAAGAGVARFHRALNGLEHRFRFARAGVHDTEAHLAALSTALVSPEGRGVPEAQGLGEAILAEGARLPLTWLRALPRRLCHGDLKISNLLFASDAPPRVRCLIDLDTLGWQSMAYELGDALRSWCNPNAEDVARPSLDAALFEEALAGYAQTALGLLTPDEVASIVPGLHAVTLELSSRFCRDAVEDSYFGWDVQRYPSRRAHNLARGRAQLALARSVQAQRDTLEAAVRRCLA